MLLMKVSGIHVQSNNIIITNVLANLVVHLNIKVKVHFKQILILT